MKEELKKMVEDILLKIKPSLGGVDLRLKDIHQGIVTIEYLPPLSNPSACHMDRTPITKEIIKEVLEDHLRNTILGFKKVNLLGTK